VRVLTEASVQGKVDILIANMQFTEEPAKRNLLVRRDVLIAKENHQVLQQGLANLGNDSVA